MQPPCILAVAPLTDCDHSLSTDLNNVSKQNCSFTPETFLDFEALGQDNQQFLDEQSIHSHPELFVWTRPWSLCQLRKCDSKTFKINVLFWKIQNKTIAIMITIWLVKRTVFVFWFFVCLKFLVLPCCGFLDHSLQKHLFFLYPPFESSAVTTCMKKLQHRDLYVNNGTTGIPKCTL